MMDTSNGLLRPYVSGLIVMYWLIDGITVASAMLLTVRHEVLGAHHFGVVMLAIALYYFFGRSYDLYRSWRVSSLLHELFRVILAWISTASILLAILFLLGRLDIFDRVSLIQWIIVVPFALGASRLLIRLAFRAARRMGRNYRVVVVFGANARGAQIASTIRNAPWMGLHLAGVFDDRKVVRGEVDLGPDKIVAGDSNDLIKLLEEQKVDAVYIALPMSAEARIQALITRLGQFPTSVYLAPDFFVFGLLQTRLTFLGDVPTLSVIETPFFSVVESWAKRVEDIVLSFSILLLIAVPMAAIAIGVKLSSPGPIIFKQQRYGIDGKPFTIWKFRTMTACEDGNNFRQATKNDIRVTRFGAYLRRTSLDELPQFINVIQGRMSIVGPRPHPTALDEDFRRLIPHYMLRHKVRPGITGWAQINGFRGETETIDKMEMRIQYDIEYISNWSLPLDIRIIFLTVFRGFMGTNAY